MLELLSPDKKNEKITICVGEMVNLLVIVILLVCCFQNLNIPEVDNFSALCFRFWVLYRAKQDGPVVLVKTYFCFIFLL